jgi:hypothetical protein
MAESSSIPSPLPVCSSSSKTVEKGERRLMKEDGRKETNWTNPKVTEDRGRQKDGERRLNKVDDSREVRWKLDEGRWTKQNKLGEAKSH